MCAYKGGVDVAPPDVISKTPIKFSGWFADQENFPAKEIRIIAGEKTIICEPKYRPDVSLHLGVKEDSCLYGFEESVFVLPGVKQIVIEAEDRLGAIHQLYRKKHKFYFSFKSYFYFLANKNIRTPHYKGGVEATPEGFLVDSSFVIKGWFADEYGRPAKYIKLKANTHTIGCKPRIRPDVSQYLGTKEPSLAFGYDEIVDMGCGLKRITIEIQTESGKIFIAYRKWHYANFKNPQKGPVPLSRNYAEWLAENEKHNPPAEPVTDGPLISILMPVYNTPGKWLRRAIESVRNQTYSNWELCIADDASTSPEVIPILKHYSNLDKRINVVYRTVNGHISVASNTALELCKGACTCLLDHDDELTRSALAEVAQVIINNPDFQVIYSDEDKINDSGEYCDPFFKPDFNYDMLLGCNYICHLLSIRTSVIKQIGGLKQGREGSQDHDLLLRAIVVSKSVIHIPRILYHWRMHDHSIAKTGAAKPYAHTAGLLALKEHVLQAFHGQATVDSLDSLYAYRVIFEIKNNPLISIIIPFKDKPQLLAACVSSILECTNYQNYEILLVDNNSAEADTKSLLTHLTGAHKNIRLITYDKTFNYSDINNVASEAAQGEYLLFLNNDTKVINREWLKEMLMHSQRYDVGAVGAFLFYPNNTIQHAGVVIGMTGLAGHIYAGQRPEEVSILRFVREVTAVTAACLMTKRELYLRAGGMDADLSVCGNDVDLCLRYQQMGYRNIFTPHAKLYHYESTTRDPNAIPKDDFIKSLKIYSPHIARGDSFYNSNLTLLATDGALRGFDEAQALEQMVGAVIGNEPALKLLKNTSSLEPKKIILK